MSIYTVHLYKSVNFKTTSNISTLRASDNARIN